MIKISQYNRWVAQIIAVALIVATTVNAAQARIRKYISNIVASRNQIYLSEFDGKILIFDVEKNKVADRVSVFGKHGRTGKVTLYNDNGRIIAVGIFDERLNRAFYEITPDNKAKKLAVITGRFNGFDNEHVYCSRPVKDPSVIRYTSFRLDKDYQNPQAGHIRGYPHLMIQVQSEDASHYWFLCSLTDQDTGKYHQGFVLVRKDKQTGDIDLYKDGEGIKRP